MTSPFTTAAEARAFIFGGNARFTLVSKTTGTRYTYRVRAAKDKRVSFVRLLTGTDNDNHYTYLGIIRGGQLKLTDKSNMTVGSPPVKAMSWTLTHLQLNYLPSTLEIWHDGHCGRCGRSLTVPSSLASGFGPECINHV